MYRLVFRTDSGATPSTVVACLGGITHTDMEASRRKTQVG